MSITSIVLDTAILIMPMPLVVKVKSTPRRKFAIISMFSLGIIIVIAGCLRLRFNIMYGDSVNITWDYVDLMIWTGVEVATSIAVTSLPSIRLMLHRLFPGLFGRLFAFGGHVEQDREQYLKVREGHQRDVEGVIGEGITRRWRRGRKEIDPPPTIGGGEARERNEKGGRASVANRDSGMPRNPPQTEASRILASIMGSLSRSQSCPSESANYTITVTTDITVASEQNIQEDNGVLGLINTSDKESSDSLNTTVEGKLERKGNRE